MFTSVTLLFVMLLIPLAGFIAWIGDRIGHKTGKRRHSLFGLRPRHTAMVVTIGTGMCIALVSFGLFWVASESFRIVMSEGGALIVKNKTLREENGALIASNAAMRQKALGAAAEVRDADNRRDRAFQLTHAAENAARKAGAQSRHAQAEAQTAERAAQTARQGLADETRRLHTAESALHSVQRSMKEITSQLKGRTKRVQVVERQLTAAEAMVSSAETRVADAEARAHDADRQAARTQQVATAALAVQKKNLDDLRGQLDELNHLYADQKARTTQQQTEFASLTKQVDDERSQLDRLRHSADALRQGQITYQVGEEVDRLAIRPGYNVWRIEAIIASLLTASSKKAEARGARRGAEQRAALLLPQTVVPRAGGEPQPVTEEDQIRAAASTIRTSNSDIVVIARAAANAVAGEPVPLELKLYRNPYVFTADTPIGAFAINGDGTRQEIADSLSAFLRREVRHSLLQAGVIPPTRGGGDGDEAYGSVVNLSPDEWLQIIDQVSSAGAHARVVVLAAKNMRAGDPVQLRFEVEGAQHASLTTSSTQAW